MGQERSLCWVFFWDAISCLPPTIYHDPHQLQDRVKRTCQLVTISTSLWTSAEDYRGFTCSATEEFQLLHLKQFLIAINYRFPYYFLVQFPIFVHYQHPRSFPGLNWLCYSSKWDWQRCINYREAHYHLSSFSILHTQLVPQLIYFTSDLLCLFHCPTTVSIGQYLPYLSHLFSDDNKDWL